MKKVTLIVNPVAGKMRVKSNLFDIVQKFGYAGYSVNVSITKDRGDAITISEALTKAECDLVVCCGGDGTLNEVICGIVRSGSGIDIGYIPCGSTNDFAQSMKLPTNHLAACDRIIEGDGKAFFRGCLLPHGGRTEEKDQSQGGRIQPAQEKR